MVDLETLGTTPGSVILSIGAVVFDPVAQTIGEDAFYAVIDRDSCIAEGLAVDPATVEWWSRQHPEAQAALLVDPRPVRDVLAEFSAWWRAQGGRNFWAHGPNFDETLLTAVYRAVAAAPPWKYWDCRCTRTIYAAANVAPDRDAGRHHNALDDAMAQARAVNAAYRVLGLCDAGAAAVNWTVRAMARAMQASKACTAVFTPGSAETLARASLAALAARDAADLCQTALSDAVQAYDQARMDVHGVAAEYRGQQAMSAANRNTIRPMIAAAVKAYLAGAAIEP